MLLAAADLGAVMPLLDAADRNLAPPVRQPALGFGEKPRLIGFDRQRIIAAGAADRSRHVFPAMQRVGGDDAVFKIEKRQGVENALHFVAAGREALRHDKARFGHPNVDEMQRRTSAPRS